MKGVNCIGTKRSSKTSLGFLVSRGWTKQSVAGILGNIQSESSLNPDIWSGDGDMVWSNGHQDQN